MPQRIFSLFSLVLIASWMVFSYYSQGGEPSALSAKPSFLEIAPGDWPFWRGPGLDGISRDQKAASHWSKTTNILWKTSIPGRGHSSPILWGNRIFLTTAEDKIQKQSILALDRSNGKITWQILAFENGFPPKNPKNSFASATQACDGEKVYSVFINRNAIHVLATSLEGKILWRQRVGDFRSEHGYGPSPVLYKSLVIVNGDNLKGCFVAALDKTSGKVVWQVDRKTTGRHGSYASPVLANLAGKSQLILTGMGEVTSYEPETGKRIWWCKGPAEVTGNTPACGDNMVFASGGFPEKEILAIRADGTGDVSKSHVVWRTAKGVSYVPSLLYHDGKLYVVSDGGVATCFESASGRTLAQVRLPGAFTSSPILVGDRLYVTNEAGKTYILKTNPKLELVTANDLAETTLATPAICGGKIYLRTERHLFCIQ